MSNPFANGSSVADLQRQQRYHEPTAPQAPDRYTQQVYANQLRSEADLQRDIERTRLAERGRHLAGFVLRDRRAEGLGFEWSRIRPALWPDLVPAGVAQQVERAITVERDARAAMTGAVMSYSQWEQAHPQASDELRRLHYEELTIDPIAVAQKAAQQVELALVTVASVTEAIEQWQEAEQAAPVKRAAADRAHEQALANIETEVMAKRVAAQRLGVAV